MPKCKPQSIQKGYYIVAKHDSDSYNCLEFRRNKSENTVDNGDIQKEEEKSPATKEKYLRSIRGFLNYAKDMPDADWQDGIIGAGSSNIAWGYSNLNGAIMGWMQDEDAYNISVLGHRRWMLNPNMPVNYFDGNTPWSISTDREEVKTNIEVVGWRSLQACFFYGVMRVILLSKTRGDICNQN